MCHCSFILSDHCIMYCCWWGLWKNGNSSFILYLFDGLISLLDGSILESSLYTPLSYDLIIMGLNLKSILNFEYEWFLMILIIIQVIIYMMSCYAYFIFIFLYNYKIYIQCFLFQILCLYFIIYLFYLFNLELYLNKF